MRRKERAITDKNQIEAIIRKAGVCRLGLAVAGTPYIVPVNFGYRDDTIYVHCALEGRKLDMIRQNNTVCFQMDVDAKIIDGGAEACKWTSSYQSIIGYGNAEIITDPDLKQKAMETIMAHYSDRTDFTYNDAVMARTGFIRIRITDISAKQLLK